MLSSLLIFWRLVSKSFCSVSGEGSKSFMVSKWTADTASWGWIWAESESYRSIRESCLLGIATSPFYTCLVVISDWPSIDPEYILLAAWTAIAGERHWWYIHQGIIERNPAHCKDNKIKTCSVLLHSIKWRQKLLYLPNTNRHWDFDAT